MKSAVTIIAHPTTAEQADALKAFVKALKIKFEVSSSADKPYNQDFVDKILQGDKDFATGNFAVLKTKELWK